VSGTLVSGPSALPGAAKPLLPAATSEAPLVFLDGWMLSDSGM
jgi:hypothetical protein